MSPDRRKRLAETMEMRRIPMCWAIVRTSVIGTGRRTHYHKEEIFVFHSSRRAKKQYARMLEAPDNGFTKDNLKIVPRRQKFGEGLYT